VLWTKLRGYYANFSILGSLGCYLIWKATARKLSKILSLSLSPLHASKTTDRLNLFSSSLSLSLSLYLSFSSQLDNVESLNNFKVCSTLFYHVINNTSWRRKKKNRKRR
jgi:hypothetical protein